MVVYYVPKFSYAKYRHLYDHVDHNDLAKSIKPKGPFWEVKQTAVNVLRQS